MMKFIEWAISHRSPEWLLLPATILGFSALFAWLFAWIILADAGLYLLSGVVFFSPAALAVWAIWEAYREDQG